MSDNDYNDAVAGLRAMRPQYSDSRIKVTGYLNTDGSTNADPTSDAQAGNLWVHGYPRGANVQVLIGPEINPHVPNVRVWVGQNQAHQAVAYGVVVDKNAVAQWGPGLPTITQQVNVPAMGLLFGRAQASEDASCPMCVHVNGFDYDDGVFLGGAWAGGNFDPTTYDFDMSADVPATPGYSVWDRIWFDPSDATLHHLAGTPVYTGGNPWVMQEADIPLIPIPAGVYPTGAVVLTYGQTTLAGAYFASNRYLLGRVGGADFDLILTDSNGDVLSDSNGNVLIGA